MSKIDVTFCKYYQEITLNDVECNSALEGHKYRICHNKDCKWSLCNENIYCEYKCENIFKNLKDKLNKIKEISKNITKSGCSMRNNDCYFSCNKCALQTLNNVIQIIDEDIK